MDLQSFLDRFGAVSQQGDGYRPRSVALLGQRDPSLLQVTPDGTALAGVAPVVRRRCAVGCGSVVQ